MDDFIIDESKRFAKVIQANVGRFEAPSTLKEQFEKELLPYKTSNSKDQFLNKLAIELKTLFESHLKRCEKPDCPQHKTFKNAMFLISEEMNDKRVSSFLVHNTEYDKILKDYHTKLKTTSSYLAKEKFIVEEIERIKNLFIHPRVEVKLLSEGIILSSFDFAEYGKFAYDWLMSGQDWPLEQILKNAKRQYLQTHPTLWNEEEFKSAIYSNMERGVAYVLYERFLSEQLKKDDGKERSKLNELFSNPWVVTIIGGLLLALFAKTWD